MLASESIKFCATTRHTVIHESNVNAPHGNFGVGVRVLKASIYNDGSVPIVVTLDGSEPDAGYGLAWTTRATVTIPARAHDVLEGAIRGQEELLRVAVKTTSGVADGRMEIIEASDNYRR